MEIVLTPHYSVEDLLVDLGYGLPLAETEVIAETDNEEF